MLNRNIDGYEITQEIGRGNAANVYVARQQPVGRYVAMKVFDHLTLDSTARLKQLFDQVEVLDHINILPMYDSGSVDDRVYWVMRYMPAGSLPPRSRVPLDQITRWLGQIAAALDYAHQHDLIHGSLKPSNVLLDHAGNAFVCDFGLAQILGSSPNDYALPEQRREFKPDIRSDVYALGALTYEMLTGRPPIDLRGREADRLNWRVTLPPLPSSIDNKLPPEIDAVVMKALAIDPLQRYSSASEFIEEFAQAQGAVESAATEAKPLDRRDATNTLVSKAKRRGIDRGWIAFGLIGLVILIIATAILLGPSPPAVMQLPNTPTPMISSTSTSIVSPTPSSASTTAPIVATTSIVSVTATDTETPVPTSTIAPTLKPTAVLTNVLRATATPITPITIDPLRLLLPRTDNGSMLMLIFHTHIRPDNAGPIGLLSMSIPSIDPLIKERELAQVGSGDQTLSVSLVMDCSLLVESITTRQVLLIIRDADGKTIYVQPLDYTKTWCQ